MPTLWGATIFAASAIAAEAQDTAPALLQLETTTAPIAPVSDLEQAETQQPLKLDTLADLPNSVEASSSQEPVDTVDAVSPDSALPNAASDAAPDTIAPHSIGQVTSVTQLSDVQPTDWAFQALQSLVERYGCIEGYPDGTYKGSRALSRYEFAAGLNACLDQVSELIAASTANIATQEDLATLQRLQEEFAAELAALRGRVDDLEARTAFLEAHQFSTTTKLNAEVIFSLQDIFGSDVESLNETVLQSRVRLNFDTSFSGSDRLRARLQYRRTGAFKRSDDLLPDSFTIGQVTPMVSFPGNSYDRETALYYQFGDDGSSVRLSQLNYAFSVGDNSSVVLGLVGTSISDIVTTVSTIDRGGSGAVGLLAYNPIYDAGTSGAGVGLVHNFTDDIQLGLGYLTADFTVGESTPGRGLFNGNYVAFGQLTFSPGPLTVGLTYVNAYNNTVTTGLPPTISNQYAVSLDYALGTGINIGGWFDYEDGILLQTADYRAITYGGYITFNDLGGAGNQLIFVAAVPPRISDYQIGDDRIGGLIDDAALHIEASYRFNVNDNISVTPAVVYVADPGNNNDNSDAIIGVIRTTFNY
ncbi:MAG: carbohydrate porin [Oscillatoriophycideae cyanobacterium NC_groundwater_1537_Pr4_S-0.65um_50_18]|nr:carbohydrate porin [Oscillatoriophycideae cyanobacterium NC_groundwater_1537_Pr4_S-0.65um_50_18]